MCTWYRLSYGCRHYLVGASAWCEEYGRTQRRCEVVITHTDWTSKKCPHCQPNESTPVAWENLINRSRDSASISWFKEGSPRHGRKKSDVGL
ncbi:hypothetical protein F5X68DRAFT_265705 [Plectosphaerella plurivora]|uniref:Uncharacterized protein n=1 Tax=Plectosphaerella plurivora TaxID=936078 RepID=A0A9P8V296_9PEZI|nr:hypothetical protein F5X68DRAFT_265705 [Plectosphaerella plurivora]